MSKIETVVIASRNPSKTARLKNLFVDRMWHTVNLEELGINNKPTETGLTAEENALIKARFYADILGLPAFSEDESLFVDFLPKNKQPGVFVRRINGQYEVSDERLLDYWRNQVAEVPENLRTGKWHIAYCLALPDGSTSIVTIDNPLIFFHPPSTIRIPGWPLNSITGSPQFNKPDSELTPAERAQVDQETRVKILTRLEKLWR